MKAFLKSRLSAQYDGDVKTADPFSLGLDVAQLQVSVGFSCALSETLKKIMLQKKLQNHLYQKTMKTTKIKSKITKITNWVFIPFY